MIRGKRTTSGIGRPRWRGSRREYLTVVVALESGEVVKIDSAGRHARDRLERIGRLLAGLYDAPFTTESS